MPTDAKPLFRPEAVRPKLRAFELPARADRSKIAKWAKMFAGSAKLKLKETEVRDRPVRTLGLRHTLAPLVLARGVRHGCRLIRMLGFGGWKIKNTAFGVIYHFAKSSIRLDTYYMIIQSAHLFRFDLDSAIKCQLIPALDNSPALQLVKNIGPAESGIYGLYWHSKLVYVGKATKTLTASKRTLRTRLNEHVTKISGRKNIVLAEMTCRFLTMESEWWVVAAEFALITHYSPEWNGSGYGSKAAGKGRPGTTLVSQWNKMFPPI